MDLATINMYRAAEGKEPLTELPTDQKNNPQDGGNGEPAKNDNPPGAEGAKNEPPVIVATDLTNEQILEALRKQGIAVNSLEDLKPKEDPTALAEKREAEILSYGLSKGKFTKKEYDSLIHDSNDRQNLVFRDFYEAAKKEDAELTDEEIQAEFADKFGLNAEPNTRRHKRGQQEIDILAEKLLKTRHSKVFAVESEYDQYTDSQNQRTQQIQKIQAGAVAYKQSIDTALDKLRKIQVQFDGESEAYEISEMEQSIEEIKNKLTNPDFAAQQILNGTSVEEISQIAYNLLLVENFPALTKKIADQHLLRHQKGTKGITPITIPQQGNDSQFTAEQQKMIDIMKSQAVVAN